MKIRILFATMFPEKHRKGDTYGIAKTKTKPSDRIRLQYTKCLFYHRLYPETKKSVLERCRGGHWPPGGHPSAELGAIVQRSIEDIPNHYPAITVDNYVVMSNHIHLLLQINTDIDGRPMAARTISTVINQTKGVISKKAGFPIWQRGFYDHVIRGEQDYLDVWNYIGGNPGKWKEDKLYVSDSQ